MNTNGYINKIQIDVPKNINTDYPFNIPSIQHFKEMKIHPKLTYLIGENGMGKSTLLEAIAVNWVLMQKVVVKISNLRLRGAILIYMII